MQTTPTNDSPRESRAWTWTGTDFKEANGIPATDRGFRYGMSVFESFPVRDGIGIFLDRHLTRLRAACVATGFTVPPGSLEQCSEVLKEAGDGFGRIYITAGDGTVTEPCDHCRVLVLVETRKPVDGATYHRGYDLGMHAAGHVPVFGGLKTGNYWSNLHAFREGVARKCNETLLFTPAGHLISACMANVFIAKDGTLKTPDLSTGARAGVMREWVMQRQTVEEGLLTRAEVEAADEIFLTSSWLGIMPVAHLEGRPLKNRTVSAPLLEAFRKEAGIR